MPRVWRCWVKALHPGISASGCLCGNSSWIDFLMTLGSDTFDSMTLPKSSNLQGLSRQRSSISTAAPALCHRMPVESVPAPYLGEVWLRGELAVRVRLSMTFLSSLRSFQPVLLAEASIFSLVRLSIACKGCYSRCADRWVAPSSGQKLEYLSRFVGKGVWLPAIIDLFFCFSAKGTYGY